MTEGPPVSCRSVLGCAAGVTAAGLVGALPSAVADQRAAGRPPLWRQAERAGIVFGSSIATWQLDPEYRQLHARECGLLWPEDDLLWYHLKPTPDSPLDFSSGDRIFRVARRHQQLRIGAFLVWDEGFGDGWSEDDLGD